MHGEMGPVRRNPIQRTVIAAHLSELMTVCSKNNNCQKQKIAKRLACTHSNMLHKHIRVIVSLIRTSANRAKLNIEELVASLCLY